MPTLIGATRVAVLAREKGGVYADDIAIGAKLILDFPGGKSGGTPYYWYNGTRYTSPERIPGWTFSRPGTNLLRHSQAFDSAVWEKIGSVSVTANALTAPDGTATADQVIEGTGTGQYLLSQSFGTPVVGTTLTKSVCAKRNGRNLYLGFDVAGGGYLRAVFNLATGTIGAAVETNSAFTNISATVTQLADGWCRCSITGTTVTRAVHQAIIRTNSTDNSFSFVYAGNGVSGIYLWGAQTEPGSVVGGYQPTTNAPITSGVNTTYAEGLVDDVVTNKVTCWNANPTEAAGFVGTPVGFTRGGEAAAILSVVDDSAALAAAGLSGVCTSGKVYKLDNSAGTTTSYLNWTWAGGNRNTHVASVWARSDGVTQLFLAGSSGGVVISAGTTYTRRVGTPAPPNILTSFGAFLAVNAGVTCYFILPQLIERPAAITQAIVTQGATVSAVVGKVNGLIPFAANVPRITSKGLLVEEARTNDLIQSTNFADAAVWLSQNGISAPVLQSATGSPLAGPVYRYTTTGTPTNQALTTAGANLPAIVIDSTYCVTFLLKRVDNDWQCVEYSDNTVASCGGWVNLATGAIGVTHTQNPAVWELPTISVRSLNAGWHLVTLIAKRLGATIGAGTASPYTFPVTANNSLTRQANASFDVAFGERQTGSSPTSPIVTTTAAATRAADYAYIADKGGAVRTNKVAIYNANPTSTAGFSKAGDAASTLSVVDDTAALAIAGLSGICTSGNVFCLDNGAGVSDTYATITGPAGVTAPHLASAYIRAIGGSSLPVVCISGVSCGSGVIGGGYARVSAYAAAPSTGAQLQVGAKPGQVVYFILPQLEAGSVATAPIVTKGSPVTVRDPFTGIGRDLGEFRTNLCIQSGNPSSASWNGAEITKTPGQADPFGGTGAALVTANGVNAAHTYFPATTGEQISYVSGFTYTFSRYVKAGSQSLLQFTGPGSIFGYAQYANFNLATQAVTASVGLTGAGAQITDEGNGWYRIAITVLATVTATQSGGAIVFIASSADGRVPATTLATNYYDTGAQVEVGTVATPYIPTTTAPVTVGNPFTMVAWADFNAVPSLSQRLASATDGTALIVVQIAKSAAGSTVGQSGVGSINVTSSGPATSGAVTRKTAMRQRTDDFRFVADGVGYGPNVITSPTGLNTLDLGQQRNSARLNGYLQRVIICGELTDAQLQGQTV